MNDIQLYDALNRIIDAKTYKKLSETMVLQVGNQYQLFQEYFIEKAHNGFLVVRSTDDSSYVFSSLRYAVTWATMDKRNMIYAANRIIELDRKLAGIELTIKLYEKYTKNSKTLNFVHQTKLLEDKMKKTTIIKELNTYMEASKLWQMNKFSQSSYK